MDGVAGIYARESAFLDRHVQLGIAQKRVLSVSFPAAPDEEATADHELLDRIEAYLQGDVDSFADVTVALTMQTDQRAVLNVVREIPYGEEMTVDRIAGATTGLDADDETDRALTREALADNPVPLLVPDHRVRDGPSATPPAVEQKLRAVEGL